MDIDNILIRQKDAIIKKINDGKFYEAMVGLSLVKELWVAADYEYKYRELRERMYGREVNTCLSGARNAGSRKQRVLD